jgi:ArsR family transcriptional regulator, arsenate/arsenite/antimonite-responsive transcriptional repressor
MAQLNVLQPASIKKTAKPELAAGIHAISDSTRRRILKALQQKGCCSIDVGEGMCACDIESQIGLSQPTVSHHMGILRKAGLVEAQKLGQWMWYRRNEKAIKQLLDDLKEEI